MNKQVIRKTIGSDLFNTAVVRTDEYVMFANVIAKEGVSVEIIDERIQAIDKMLILQRQASLNNMLRYTRAGRMRKNVGLMYDLDRIVGRLVDEEEAIIKNKNNG